MRVMAIDSYGPVDRLREVEIDTPEAGPGQIRVEVHASAVSPADWKVLTGKAKILHGRQFPMVVGYDFSGVVDAVGDGVEEPAVGDAVFGFLHYNGKTKVGTYAEYVLVTPDMVAPKPKRLSHEDAAGIGTGFATALQAIRDHGRLQEGGRLLVVGASGGVGTAAVAIGKAMGATVTGVCRGHAVELVESLGADRVLDREQVDARAEAGPHEVVLDAAAAWTYHQAAPLLVAGGTYITTLPSFALLTGFLRSLFSSRRCRFVAVKPRTNDLELLGRWAVQGAIQIPFDSDYPVREVADAIERMRRGEMKGRIGIDVLDGFES